jgi:mono/diheme cytochrome c family protein
MLIRSLLVAGILLALAIGAIAYVVIGRGLSTRTEPSRLEALVARAMRRAAMSGDAAARTNPVARTDEVIAEARAHFADHCAICHANDGSGETEIGRSLYPRAPDMRAASTQSLSDGEIFAIIEEGIRLTGMPGWATGTTDGERDSWGLVHFIRRLPALTADELAEMDTLNPKSRHEWQQDEAARRFLAGEDPAPAAPESSHGHR